MMRKLSDLSLPNQFRNDTGGTVGVLYEECLPLSVRFDRAVGYFSSSVFTSCAESYAKFFSRGGYIRMVTSPVFSENDIASIVSAIRERPKILKKAKSQLL